MGQFLIIGLKLKACVYKDSINNYINEDTAGHLVPADFQLFII